MICRMAARRAPNKTRKIADLLESAILVDVNGA